MKVIFLDIDGVLNCTETAERHNGYIGIDPDLIARFNELRARTGAEVVLSSTWRKDDDWREVMRSHGLGEMLDRTPSLASRFRGDEVDAWLKEHPEVTQYAILDDDSDFHDHQFVIHPSYFKGGLQPDHCEAIATHLL